LDKAIHECYCRFNAALRPAICSGKTIIWKGPRMRPSVLAAAIATIFAAGPVHAACPPLLAHTLPRLQDEKPVDLCQHAGKVVLVVNTASHCGFTPQYKALETLSDRYGARGLVVLGFPSNDFGGQEPAANAQIADFCENQFGVRFPMFTKSAVRPGKGAINPLYAALAQKTGTPPQWNFHKYLIDRRGLNVSSHLSEVDPLGPGFIREVERLLDAK
jgi:glutathione peroxidase